MLSFELFKNFLFSRRSGAIVRIVAALCVLGVTLGVAALIIVVSVMNGFQGSLRDRLLSIEPHLIVSVKGFTRQDDYIDHPIHKYLKSLPDTKVFLTESQDVILRTVDGIVHAAIARGVNKESMEYIINETEKISRRLEAQKVGYGTEKESKWLESTLGSNEIYVGLELANLLNLYEGDKITVVPPEGLLLPPGEIPPFETLTVRGVIDSNYGEHDSKMIYYGLGKSFYRLRDTASRLMGIEVRVKDPENISGLKAKLEALGADVETWKDRNSNLLLALFLERFLVGLLLGMSAIIAGFSMITVVVLLMTQKKKEMGVFMSIGLSTVRTRRLFMKMGLLLSGSGLFFGVSIGLVSCFLIDRYSKGILPDIYYDSSIPAKVDPNQMTWILSIAVILCILTSWLSTRKIRDLTASEALRGNTSHEI